MILAGGTDGAGKPVLYRSTNGGVDWTQLALPLAYAPKALAIDPRNPKIVYFTSSSRAFRSADGGATWTELAGVWGGNSIAINRLNPAEVFIGGWNGVFYSKDRGVTWASLNEGLPSTSVYQIALDPVGRKIYAGTASGGVCRRSF